jgi:cytochrome bd-type quinol oxidase subunit 1/mono/diheme cytochrome c family protein
MNYPVWDVPVIGSGWVIGSIAIFHIMISHFAVGGGLYLPFAERKALKAGRKDWMEALQWHSRFFLILTGVFGAASGVGIWFAIGLASPEGTSTLIHYFVFAWAIEWVFFMIELSAAAVYYYTWNRIPDKLHLKIGYVYAVASLFTLIVINGILTFMLTPGETWLAVAGTGAESSKFWAAFFNPTYWPGMILRFLVCLSLAGIWALVTGSLIDGDKHEQLKTEVIRFSAKWLLPAFFLMPFCLLWYLYMVPESQRGLLELGMSTIGAGTFTQVTRTVLITCMTSATIMAVVYLIAWKNPKEFRFGYACAVLLLALAATGSTEHAREMLRKPYVVGEHMYSNGVRVSEVAMFNSNGYLAKTPWASEEEQAAWIAYDEKLANNIIKTSGNEGAQPVRTPDIVARGELMFRGQCLACHTREGYRSIEKLLKGRDYNSIGNIVNMLHDYSEESPYRKFMPPAVGTEGELESLKVYLDTLINETEVEIKTTTPDPSEIANATDHTD